MRILAFYPYLPYPLDRGGHYRGFHLLRELARGHEVDLLALSEDGEGREHVEVFERFCRRVELVEFKHPPWQKLLSGRLRNRLPATIAHWSAPSVAQTLERMLRTTNYEAVHVFDIVLAQYLLQERLSVPVVIDRTRVDLQYQWMERERVRGTWKDRLLDWEKLAKLWAFEKRVARRCRGQVVCGSDDADFIRRRISRTLELLIIPNGVDLEYFQAGSSDQFRRSIHPTILFCGAMDYTPNVDALRWYFSEIHDVLVRAISNLEFQIVGKNPGPEIRAYASQPGVVVTGAVPDVRPYYRRAWLQVVPLRIGGGTRLKIVESLAMGTPVLSTRIGAQGLDLTHDREILLADTAHQFIHQTIRALQDACLRERLAVGGLATVKARFSWSSLGARLAQFYTRDPTGGRRGGSTDPVDSAAPRREPAEAALRTRAASSD